MSIFSRGEFRAPSSNALLVYIGADYVAVSIVDYSARVPLVRAYSRSDMQIQKEVSLEILEKEMHKSLGHALFDLFSKTRENPSRVAVCLGSPWYASGVRKAALSRSAPFVLSQKLLDDIVSKEIKAFEDEEIAHRSGTEGAIRIIESRTTRALLNGYQEPNPVGFTAKELELSLFISVASERLLQRIESIVEKTYPNLPVFFSSLTCVGYLAMQRMFSHQGEYLFLDIGGEVTEASRIIDRTLSNPVSFPQGTNTLMRAFRNQMGVSSDEARSLSTLYLEGKLKGEAEASCKKIFRNIESSWTRGFETLLASMADGRYAPITSMLLCPSSLAPFYKRLIENCVFHGRSHDRDGFRVILLTPELFHEDLSFVPGVARDTCTMLQAIGAPTHPFRS